MTAAALHQSTAMSARQLRALARQPMYMAVTVVQPLIWLLLFGALFKRVTDLPGFGHGVSYIDYLTPGMVVMSAMFSAGWNGMAMLNDLQRGVLDRFLTTPARRGPLVAGPLMQAVIVVLIQSVVLLVLGAIAGASFPGGVVGIAVLLVAAGLLGAAMAGLSNALALITRQEESLIGAVQFLVLPLSFLSSIFIAQALLPGWIADVAKVNPVNWAIEAARSALSSDVDWGLVLPRLGGLAAIAVLAGWWATRAFRAYQRAL
jgi:ABC-2 type transport system permease protein